MFTVNVTGVERQYYQKGTKSHKQALQKNSYNK